MVIAQIPASVCIQATAETESLPSSVVVQVLADTEALPSSVCVQKTGLTAGLTADAWFENEAPPIIGGPLWYVDKAATGANSGLNWTDAWESFGDIDWPSISPGHTVYISGGPQGSTKTYTESLIIKQGGTSGSPVTIAIDQNNPLHNGQVVISGQMQAGYGIANTSVYNQTGPGHIVISGANPYAPVYTEVTQAGHTYNIQCGISVEEWFDAKDQTNSIAEGVYFNPAKDVTIEHVRVYKIGYSSGRIPPDGYDLSWNWNGMQLRNAEGARVRHCHVSWCGQDGINFHGTAASTWGVNEVKNSVIMHITDDGIGGSCSIDIAHNCIGHCYNHYWLPVEYPDGIGHPDGMQPQGSYCRIHHNEVFNCHTYHIFWCMVTAAGATPGYTRIYRNLIYRTQDGIDNDADPRIAYQAGRGISLQPRPNTDHFVDILVANNTIINTGRWAIVACEGPTPGVNDVCLRNNLIYNCGEAVTYGAYGSEEADENYNYDLLGWDGDTDHGQATIMWTNSTTEKTWAQFLALGQEANGVLGVDPAVDPVHGQGQPIFENYSWLSYVGGQDVESDYRLAATSPCGIAQGENLSAWLDTTPELNVDFDGRVIDGPWDIGAYQYVAAQGLPSQGAIGGVQGPLGFAATPAGVCTYRKGGNYF